jgi:hypothetical protein
VLIWRILASRWLGGKHFRRGSGEKIKVCKPLAPANVLGDVGLCLGLRRVRFGGGHRAAFHRGTRAGDGGLDRAEQIELIGRRT